MAKRLADFLGCRFSSWFDATSTYDGAVYYVPDRTILADACDALGIVSEHQLFGGVVPFRFVATKVISHPVMSLESRVPDGWSHALGPRLTEVVLPGFSAFSRADAIAASKRLLAGGGIRLKPAWCKGGEGQAVAASLDQATAALDALDQGRLESRGIVVERNLGREATTLSIGQITVGAITLSYVGKQYQTPDNQGRMVYGGSELDFVRGNMSGLDTIARTPAMKRAIDQARHYDQVVAESYRPWFASRRNYDVIHGFDAGGAAMSGVLEQSWRAGGASPAEIAALNAFRDDPALAFVRACSCERYGPVAVPDDADVYYQDDDPIVGPLVKFSRVQARGHQR